MPVGIPKPTRTPFSVDAFGEFPPGRVCVHWTDAPRPSTPELEQLIEQSWREAFARSQRTGAILFNGPLVRWLGQRVEDGVLHIDAAPTDYRDFVGTNLYNNRCLPEFGQARFSNPIGTTATILSDDGWLLYGRRSHRVAWHAGYLHTFGGALEAADIRADGTIDPFAAVRRELREELRLEEEHIADTVCVGLIHDHEIWQPELLFETRVALSRDGVLGRLDRTDPHQEHTAIEYVRDEPDALVPFIRSAAPVAPVAVAAICLHGRRRWGRQWFEHALAALAV
ncbi:MAG: hypothetical protein ACPMAQ_03010 [Phycisphaerae bacterium]